MKIAFIVCLLAFYSFTPKNDLVINTSVESCDKYRNVKIIFVKCDKSYSPEYIASCKVEGDRVVIPGVFSNDVFRNHYESADYMKVKLLRGTACDEQIVKL